MNGAAASIRAVDLASAEKIAERLIERKIEREDAELIAAVTWMHNGGATFDALDYVVHRMSKSRAVTLLRLRDKHHPARVTWIVANGRDVAAIEQEQPPQS